eukprot:6274228-Lingulodinium_polyedra.AAC.1
MAWALPCCGNIWCSREGWSKRCFSILHCDAQGREESLLGYIGGGEGPDDTIEHDITLLRAASLAKEIDGVVINQDT